MVFVLEMYVIFTLQILCEIEIVCNNSKDLYVMYLILKPSPYKNVKYYQKSTNFLLKANILSKL